MANKGIGNTILKRICVGIMIMVLVLVNMPYNYNNKVNAATKLKLAKSRLNMYVGTKYKFKIKGCRWQSSRKKVASINSKGLLKAKKAGNTKITATSKKSGKRAVCSVKVGKYVSKLNVLSADTLVLKPGQSGKIRASVAPVSTLYSDIIYTSENSAVAKVDKTGVVKPVAEGVTAVSLKTKAVNSKGKRLTKKITVVVLNTIDKIDENNNNNNSEEEEIPDLLLSQKDYDFVVIPANPTTQPTQVPAETISPTASVAPTSTSEATSTPAPSQAASTAPSPSTAPTSTSEPTVTPASSLTPAPTLTPSPTPSPTPEPTATPAPTLAPTPTPTPVSVQDYINSLVPSNDKPLAGSILVANAQGSQRTLYFLNKEYTGNIKIIVDGYSYANSSSVAEFLSELEKQTGGVTNSAGTVKVSRKNKNSAWTIELLKTGQKYYISASLQDNLYNSGFGLIIASGDTRGHITFTK